MYFLGCLWEKSGSCISSGSVYEQNAVCILLSLFYPGIRNIRIGSTLPAFIRPEVLNVLQEKLNLMPVRTRGEYLKAILG